MAGNTIGTYVDDSTLDTLSAVLAVENRPKSQILGVALKAFLACPALTNAREGEYDTVPVTLSDYVSLKLWASKISRA